MSNELLEKAIAADTTARATFSSTTGLDGIHTGSEAGNVDYLIQNNQLDS
jgi:hypothetical protein